MCTLFRHDLEAVVLLAAATLCLSRMRPSSPILMMDYDSPIGRLLRAVLKANHYKVFDAETDEQGIMEAVNSQSDVIIMDQWLPV